MCWYVTGCLQLSAEFYKTVKKKRSGCNILSCTCISLFTFIQYGKFRLYCPEITGSRQAVTMKEKSITDVYMKHHRVDFTLYKLSHERSEVIINRYSWSVTHGTWDSKFILCLGNNSTTSGSIYYCGFNGAFDQVTWPSSAGLCPVVIEL